MQNTEIALAQPGLKVKIAQKEPFFAPAGRQTAGGKAFFNSSEGSGNGFFRPGAQPAVQAQLTIGAPGDKYEQEADRVAERVVSQPAVIQRETATTPASNEDRREFVQTAIRFLDTAAEFYLQQSQLSQDRINSLFASLNSTFGNAKSIITQFLNGDGTLQQQLQTAFTRALNSLFTRGATLTNTTIRSQYFRFIASIPEWAFPDFSQTEGQVQLTATVGLGGTNAIPDVLAVQQRLVELRYLSQPDFISEQVTLPGQSGGQPGSPTQPPGPVDMTTRPKTMEAIANFSRAAFGRPGLIIQPGEISERFLNAPLPQALGGVNIAGTVGRNGINTPSDVRSVQERLLAINYLDQASHQQELVAADAQNVDENAIPNTINALARFNREAAGINLWIIRPDSREETLLNNPPRFTTTALELARSVGSGQNNAPRDVRTVQDRLQNLGYLPLPEHTREAVDLDDPATPVNIPDTQIPQSIAALRSFQLAMGLTGNGQVTPGSSCHRMLIRPGLPTSRSIVLTASVGVGGGGRANNNQPADVRAIQDRLHELDILATGNYLAEVAASNTIGQVNATQIPYTIEAIRAFQRTVSGTVDGNIDPGGATLRALNDPTYGTLTSFNPEAANQQAGVAFTGNTGQDLNRIIQAIEQWEAGGLSGEAPAALINAAGIPASFGSGQMIGGTALSVLMQPGNNQLREFYGLDMATLTTLNQRATATGTRYNQIYSQVPANGTTEANLQGLFNTYIQQNGASFHTDTGLFDDDIVRMFRVAQIRRRILAVNIPRQQDTTVVNQADINPTVNTLLTNADFTASYNALGFNRSSLQAYVRRTASLGENRAGFITKAILMHPAGQNIRNAMTDASGRSIGRMLIRDNFNAADAVVPQNQANRQRVVAAITAYSHNTGGAAQAAFNGLANVIANNYVTHVLNIWDNL